MIHLLAALALVQAPQAPAPYERWTTLVAAELLHLQAEPPRALVASNGRLQCFGLETKQKLWETPIEGWRPPARPTFHLVDGMWIVAWEPLLVRLNPATGAVIWKLEGEPVALDARGFVTGDWPEGYHKPAPKQVIDPATGKPRWSLPDPPAGGTWGRPAWSELGLLSLARSKEGTRLSLRKAADGAEAWSREVKGRVGDFRNGACSGRRALVDFYDPECSGGPSDARYHDPKPGDPPCIRHELVDLADGAILWESTTGGRKHMVGHHGEAIPEEFSPDRGGTVAICGPRIASYDLATSTLKLFGPLKAAVELEAEVKGAVSVSARDLPFPGIRVKARSGRAGWREGFYDLVAARWTWVDLRDENDEVRWVDRDRALVDVSDEPGGDKSRLGLVRFGEKGMQRIWGLRYERESVSGGWQINDPIVDAAGGEILIYGFPGNAATVLQVIDLATGAETFKDEVPNHGGDFWIRKLGRYVVLPGDNGFEILRRR